jgi:hypothetical protein
MKFWKRAAIIGLTVFGSACQTDDNTDKMLSLKIEKHLIAKHSDIDLNRYARFYVHDNFVSVSAVYLFANPGYEPSQGEVGHVYWVSTNELPDIMDGGCSVINLKYNTITDKLVSVFCNGDA